MTEQDEDAEDLVLPEPLLQLPSFLLFQLVRETRQISTRVHADDLRMPHLMVLATLEWFGPAAQKDISRRLRIDASDLVSVLDDLEERKLVERRRDERDRRRYLVTMTTPGASALHSRMVTARKLNDILLAPLSQEERDRLHEMLVRIYQHHDRQRVPRTLVRRLASRTGAHQSMTG
jgi:DNA-binding MarR family transcriptional regulator